MLRFILVCGTGLLVGFFVELYLDLLHQSIDRVRCFFFSPSFVARCVGALPGFMSVCACVHVLFLFCYCPALGQPHAERIE